MAANIDVFHLHLLNDIFLGEFRPCEIDCYANNRLENETA